MAIDKIRAKILIADTITASQHITKVFNECIGEKTLPRDIEVGWHITNQ